MNWLNTNFKVEFLFGIENTKHSVIARHEFFFKYTLHTYSAFNVEIEDNVFSNDWKICGTEHVFSMGYSISIGGRTKRKQRNSQKKRNYPFSDSSFFYIQV